MLCPICKRNELKDWETVCEECWKLYGEIDRLFGTNYQQQIAEKGRVILLLPKIEVVRVEVYYPLSVEERIKRARKIARKYCVSCNSDNCKGCIWYHLMNEILGGDP